MITDGLPDLLLAAFAQCKRRGVGACALGGEGSTHSTPGLLRAGLAALLMGFVMVSAAVAQTPPSGSQSVAPPKAIPAPSAGEHYQPERFAGRAGTYYRVVWGVDSLAVKWTESGEVIRFSYRVLDADKAKVLNDKRAEPSLVDPRAGVSLVVPSMENVGQLRQSAEAENGKSYWMTFSNKGRLVKRGDHVIVVIGQFRADGLVVD